ncbi:hypothetical protein BJ165DRAFT_1509274, partial [Panaeolus papilionaceus]
MRNGRRYMRAYARQWMSAWGILTLYDLLSLNMIAMIATEYTSEFWDNCALVSGKRQDISQSPALNQAGRITP